MNKKGKKYWKGPLPKERHTISVSPGAWALIKEWLGQIRLMEKYYESMGESFDYNKFKLIYDEPEPEEEPEIETNPIKTVPERNFPVPDGLTQDQETAWHAMCSGSDVFITGGAGTGKSYILKKYIEACNNEDSDARYNVLIAASTGAAAHNICGRTIHSLFNLRIGIADMEDDMFDMPPRPSNSDKKQRTPQYYAYENAKKIFLKWYQQKTLTRQLVSAADILIIDEISMVRADLFNRITNILDAITHFTDKKIQLIVCGDFCQLAPILKGEDSENWYKTGHGGTYAFQTDAWKEFHFKNCYMKQIVRQKEQPFADALNKIRMGDPGGMKWILNHSAKQRDSKVITITAIRRDAERMNKEAVSALPGSIYESETMIEGNVRSEDIVVDMILSLKKGIRVMMLINDPENRFHNGSYATVTGIDEEEEIVYVLIDDAEESIAIEKHEWKITEQRLKMVNGKYRLVFQETGSFMQFPMRPAAACTIHKSQGQTFDRMTLDASRIWDGAQAYVALSRASDVQKMYIQGASKLAEKVGQDPAVVDFYHQIEDSDS